MKHKKIFITGIAVFSAGLIACFSSIAASGFSYSKLQSEYMETSEYEITDNFKKIDLSNNEMNNIVFERSNSSKAKVVCTVRKNSQCDAKSESDTLKISSKTEKKGWSFSFNFGPFSSDSTEIKVYLPSESYDSLTVKSSWGNVNMPADFKFNAAKIETSSGNINWSTQISTKAEAETSAGNIRFSNMTAENLNLKTSAGNIELNNTVCKNSLEAETNMGNINFNHSDAKSINAESNMGNIRGTLLTGKQFSTKTNTGSAKVPESTGDQKCELVTNMGDIDVSIAK